MNVGTSNRISITLLSSHSLIQGILKNNKWRKDYNVASLTVDHPSVSKNLSLNKAVVLRHRDMHGRPVIYIPAKNHSVNDREIEELTQFIVHCLVSLTMNWSRCWKNSDNLTDFLLRIPEKHQWNLMAHRIILKSLKRIPKKLFELLLFACWKIKIYKKIL